MLQALITNQPTCCVAYFCPCCCAYYLRSKVLGRDWSRYSCCQGYFCPPDYCGESRCPQFCLLMESVFCLGPSVSSSRLYTMDQLDLQPDPCDNQLIRFSNCLQITACICSLLSIFIDQLRDAAQVMRCIADLAFYSTLGCMVSQTEYEVKHQQRYQAPLTRVDVVESQPPSTEPNKEPFINK